MMAAPKIAFADAIRAAGLAPPDVIHADGKIHRFPTNGKRGDDSGWYVLYPDGIPAGSFGDWRTSQHETWHADLGRRFSPEESIELKRRAEVARAERDAERQRQQAAAAEQARTLTDAAVGNVEEHPYAQRKRVALGPRIKRGPWPQRGWTNALLVPLYSARGEVTSVEAIGDDGEKDFLKGGAKQGSFHPFGRIREATGVVLIGEGVATVAAAVQATGYPGVAAMDAGNVSAVAQVVRELAPDADIVLLADHDPRSGRGLEAAQDAAQACRGRVASCGEGDVARDFWDVWSESGADAVKRAVEAAIGPGRTEHVASLEKAPEDDLTRRFRLVTMLELVDLKLPEPEPLLAPWLCAQRLAQVHAWRGTGKTHFSLGVAYAVATGGTFLRWSAPQPRPVLFLDGEMPGAALQERLNAILDADVRDTELDGGMLRFITPDLLEGAPPDLANAGDQAMLAKVVASFEPRLIVVDNISSLVRSGGAENDAEAWIPVQAWALQMRREGRAVLFVHHTGKGGKQRGTSKREDVLDVVLSLRHPEPYDPADGARFIVEFEKARHLRGDDAKTFEAKLGTDVHGRQCWTTTDIEISTVERVVALYRDGVTKVKELADELGVNKSTASRSLRKAREQGLIPSDQSREAA